MSKTRIHELAKEINVSNKDLIDSAHQLGYDVKNHMSTLEDQEIKQLKGKFMKKASEGTEPKTEKTSEIKESKAASTKSTPAVEATNDQKPEKHHKIIYDRSKEIKEEENRRAQSKPYDNRKPYNNNRTNQGVNQSTQGQSTAAPTTTTSTPAPAQNQGAVDNRGERKPYNNNYQKQGYDNRNRTSDNRQGDASKPYERKPYEQRDPNRAPRPQGDGQQKPYNRPSGSYDNKTGERKPYEKRPYDPNKPAYEKRPYDPNKPPYEKKPYDPNKPYERKPYDPNKPYERKPYDPNKPAYEKKPYDPNKPYERKPRPVGPDGKPIYNNEGGYKGNRPAGQGGYNRTGTGSKPYGSGGYSGGYKDKDGSPSQGKKLDSTMKSAFSTSDIQEKTPKKKKQKKDKIVVTFDTDKLETKSKKAKKLLKEEIIVNEVDPRREFDFGKKVKQKSGKYKEKTEKEKSEKLDEILAKEVVLVPAEMTIKTFAETINKPATEIIMKMMAMGNMASLNKIIDYDTAATVALDYNILLEPEVVEEENQFEIFDLDTPDDPKDLVKRAPVVTVMGHVDHGKTSLLDAIRNTGVASGEAGGITQHIGASEVVHNGEKIVFLDTPGHEAFTSLRARGAKVTDIAILVVAADDGVMPQTIEAIDHSKAAKVPIIVAINKIDKPNANPDRVKQELSDRGVVIEEWGGDVIAVPVSAKTGEGLDTLLEMILLVSEVLELKANPSRPGVGTVIEAKVVKGRGTATTIILEKGTLNVGDPVVAGTTYGKIKAMYNDKGKKVKHIGPSTTVEIDGLSDIPQAGEKIYVTPDEKTARVIADRHAITFREKSLNKNPGVTLEDIFSRIKDGGMKELNIIIKADVQGSVEAIKQSLLKLSNEEVRVNIIRADVGAISESDVILASASSAIIIGFNVRPSAVVTSTADQEGVDIRTYQIIYNAINDVETAMKGMLDPLYKEVILGRIQVRATFKIPGGVIAGGYVTTGKVTRNAQVRVIRDGIVINEGKISSLKRFKDDVKEVATGFECGIGIEKFNDLKENDEIEAFIMEEVKR